jgi:hypothetical protein
MRTAPARAADAVGLARLHFMRYLNFTPQLTVYQRFVLSPNRMIWLGFSIMRQNASGARNGFRIKANTASKGARSDAGLFGLSR